MGEWFAYLHLECLPEATLAQELGELLPAIARDYGSQTICMLNQLWCPLRVEALNPRLYLEQLRLADNLLWAAKLPYADYRRELPFAYWQHRWEEDAFVMPSALARELRLFAAVREPLFFQDVFDIFPYLGDKPYTRELKWIRVRDPVVYHLLHPRPFREYRREFFDAVRALPELFGHLAHYSFAADARSFVEDQLLRRVNVTDATLNDFYNHLRHGANGDYVYVLNPQTRTVALTNVKRGEEDAERVEITSGLQGGETVITEGADRLKDGAKVTLPGDRPRGAGGQGGQDNWKGRQGAQDGAQQGQPGQAGQHRRRQQQEGAAQ